MARTTDTAVKGILVDHYDSVTNPSLTPFIETATSLVDYVEDQDEDSVLSASMLEGIERWLSAHFYAHADQLRQSKSTGRASAVYQGKTDMALDSTQYGQTAKLLDVSGTLAELDRQSKEGRPTAGGAWLGHDYDTINYEDV